MAVAGWGAEAAVVGWSVLVVVGGLVQALVQVPSLRRVGWRGWPRVDATFSDPGLRTVVRRMGPIALALSGTQVMIFVTTSIASGDERWPAALNYAFRLIHLPIGLVGVALGTVALAAGSRLAAEGRDADLADVVRRGLRLNLFFALPSAAGLAALATPIVRLVYERHEFRPEDTVLVAEAVRWYALGIAFYAGVKVATTPFHARGDTRTPMRCSLAGIAVTIAAAFAGVATIGFAALPISTAAGTAVNFVALRALDRRAHGAGSSPGLSYDLRVLAATASTGLAALGLSRVALERGPLSDHGFVTAALALTAVVALCAALYLGVARALGIDEASGIVRAFRRRGRTSPDR
jgi:putative peptidoglycan lipid II flippase